MKIEFDLYEFLNDRVTALYVLFLPVTATYIIATKYS